MERFVFASTGGALIGDAPAPVDESSVPRPISPYGASKLCGEGYCRAFHGSYGLSTSPCASPTSTGRARSSRRAR